VEDSPKKNERILDLEELDHDE
jgi:hypothetical protein